MTTSLLVNGRLGPKPSPHLRHIIDLRGSTVDAGWASRVLAIVLAARGDHRKTLQALEILGLSNGGGRGVQKPRPPHRKT